MEEGDRQEEELGHDTYLSVFLVLFLNLCFYPFVLSRRSVHRHEQALSPHFPFLLAVSLSLPFTSSPFSFFPLFSFFSLSHRLALSLLQKLETVTALDAAHAHTAQLIRDYHTTGFNLETSQHDIATFRSEITNCEQAQEDQND